MKSVAVMEGFAGGPRLSKNFRASLEAAGFKLTKPSQADIIIAHSTACYDLPKITKAKLYLLIGPPHWPGISIFKRTHNKSKTDKLEIIDKYGRRHWSRKRRLQRFYVLAKPRYLYLALAKHSSLKFLDSLKERQVVLVRNQNDPYCTPDIKNLVKDYAYVKFIGLPGGHDDYYENPQPYIDLLRKEI